MAVACITEVFVAFRSVSNVHCDTRTLGYVTKFASGPETGQKATIVTKDKKLNS